MASNSNEKALQTLSIQIANQALNLALTQQAKDEAEERAAELESLVAQLQEHQGQLEAQLQEANTNVAKLSDARPSKSRAGRSTPEVVEGEVIGE